MQPLYAIHMTKNLQKTASKQGIPIQVLNPFEASKKYSYQYVHAAEDLQNYVDSHWAMHWDLEGKTPFKVELASSPYVAFTFTPFGCFLTGVSTKVYQYTISGRGSLYGTLFKPGGFYGLYQNSVHQITDKEMIASTVFPSLDENLNTRILKSATDKTAILLIEEAIRALPRQNSQYVTLLQEITQYARDNPSAGTKSIAHNFAMGERRLQELFHDQVGVGVKWIIMRERLHSAMAVAAHAKTAPNWADTAQELGYSDQSHFINDFKRIVGVTPSQYYAAIRSARDSGKSGRG